MSQFVAWLDDPQAQAEHAYQRAMAECRRVRASGKPVFRTPKLGEPKRLSDSTIRNILNPVRSCFATARSEGLIRNNPATGLALPHREKIEDDDGEQVKPLTREQLATILKVVHPRHRLMFKLLAATGMRISEAIALEWRHVRLDGPEPCIRIKRGIVRGRVQPPKSKYGRRDIPIAADIVAELRAHQRDSEWPGAEQLVFPSTTGTPINPENLRNRVLRPATEEAGCAWCGFHTFRHTTASMLFAKGSPSRRCRSGWATTRPASRWTLTST
jgi:integrase